MKITFAFCAFFLLTGHSCHEHELEDPTALPSGDARGDSFAGHYLWDVLTVQCDGDCGTRCLVGSSDTLEVDLWQDDGYLQALGSIDLDGGIDGDGAFDIGGHESSEIITRARGTIDGSAVRGDFYRSYRDGECIGVARLLGDRD